jgi:hypothetical protein
MGKSTETGDNPVKKTLTTFDRAAAALRAVVNQPRRALISTVILLGVALLALAACTTVNSSAPPNPRGSSPPSGTGPPSNPAAPSTPGFLVPSTLAQSMANEQGQSLTAAPASDYNSTDNATIRITCQSTGTDTFTCTGSDTDGDVGSADNVNVAANGSSWSDSGMTWTGPDVSVPGGFTVGSVTGWTAG